MSSQMQLQGETVQRSVPQALRGCLDGFSDHQLRGWALDDADPGAPLELLVLIDGDAVGQCRASILRDDLRAAGIGNGEHAFSFQVPPRFFDGKEHQVHVVEPLSRAPLSNSPMSLRFPFPSAESSISGKIERVDSAWLIGWLSNPSQPSQPIEFSLSEFGRVLARGHADQRRPDGSFGFGIRLPQETCDGRAHAFTIHAGGQQVAATAVVTPLLLTSAEILQDYAATPLLGRLANAASYRYHGLLEQMKRIGSLPKGEAATWAHDMDVAHTFLVHGPKKRGPESVYETFGFPEVKKPVASILVPVHNKFFYTYHCLASLRLMANDASFEVIVLDDGSSDETARLEEIVKGVRVVRHETALGFLRNCNEGAKAARGDYVVLLNNDTEVTPHWLDHLLRPFTKFDDVGLVGAKLIFGNGTLQEAGGIVWGDGNAWNYGRGGNPHDPRYGYLREADYCSGACIALERAFWEKLGGFDEEFAPAYYEDTDLAFRVRAAGKRVLYQPLSEIIHFEGVSSGTNVSSGIKRYQAINKPKFLARWSSDFRGNGKPGRNPDVNKERGYSRRALLIDTEVPQPDRSAGHYAAVQEMRLLQSLGFKVTFLPQNMANLGRYNDELAEMGVETVYAPFDLSPEEFLLKRGEEFDLVYITRYHVARDLLDLVRRLCPWAKVILNNADLHFLRQLRAMISEGKRQRMDEVAKVRAEELDVMRRVDLTLSYNEVEHAVILSHNLDETKVAKCPWVVNAKTKVPPFEARQDIAFLGGFRHTPNVEAVQFFVRDVMPLVRHALPGVKFRIYGSFPPPELYELESEDVIVEGFVESVDQVFETCRVFVAPLLTGAGIKGKVLEALAQGTPSVLTPIAAEGIGIRDGLEAHIATEPAQWSKKIRRLYEDADLWQATSSAAVSFVGEAYSFERGRQLMEEALTTVNVPVSSGLYAKN